MAWNIDAAHSAVTFTVSHMMIAQTRGRFNKFEASVSVDEANPSNSKVEATIEVASIDTGNEQRDGHLLSGDLFDAENHPTMTFSSTRIEAAGEGSYKVTGEMTIKGVTREVVLDLTDGGQGKDPWGNIRQGLSATTQINRQDFGLTWNVPLETGGFLVGNQVSIAIDLELVAS